MERVATKTKKENKRASFFSETLLRNIGRQALIKKKCRFAVFAIDSKFAMGSKIRERDNTDLEFLLGIYSEEAWKIVNATHDNIKVLNKKKTCAALCSGNKVTSLPEIRAIKSKYPAYGEKISFGKDIARAS